MLNTPAGAVMALHRRDWSYLKCVAVVSKRSIELKIKAGQAGQPQEYYLYFEDWPARPNTDIEFEGAF